MNLQKNADGTDIHPSFILAVALISLVIARKMQEGKFYALNKIVKRVYYQSMQAQVRAQNTTVTCEPLIYEVSGSSLPKLNTIIINF